MEEARHAVTLLGAMTHERLQYFSTTPRRSVLARMNQTVFVGSTRREWGGAAEWSWEDTKVLPAHVELVAGGPASSDHTDKIAVEQKMALGPGRGAHGHAHHRLSGTRTF
ncbi:hypothetical protein N7468_000865 [Penicillium chermesinum]|uniref:Uncharacterized protein n=1 Tax=Penicillium chermesinum TaxID=63820 RepID=A0A9W9PGK4_9EURO|nr:uncharacterized protein N7468_000865 [Penicillium chermesinum]KAJ5245882.1 hypothetical protein N7468_000865 [Penicillium chermesinum]